MPDGHLKNALKATFGASYVIQDAKEDFSLSTLPVDIDNAIPEDPTACAPGIYTLKAPKGTLRLGEASKRRAHLEKLRSDGKASPVKSRGDKRRRRVTNRLLHVV